MNDRPQDRTRRCNGGKGNEFVSIRAYAPAYRSGRSCCRPLVGFDEALFGFFLHRRFVFPRHTADQLRSAISIHRFSHFKRLRASNLPLSALLTGSSSSAAIDSGHFRADSPRFRNVGSGLGIACCEANAGAYRKGNPNGLHHAAIFLSCRNRCGLRASYQKATRGGSSKQTSDRGLA